MDRSEILDMMAALQLSGMRAAYDEIVTTGIKRKHSIDHIIAALLKAEIAEKHARSIRYQMGIAKLPLAKELADFAFADTPINEQLVRDLANGNFLAQQRNVVAVGGTGTGKSLSTGSLHADQPVRLGRGEDVDHLSAAVLPTLELALHSAQRPRQLHERCTVAQGTRLLPQHVEVVPGIVFDVVARKRARVISDHRAILLDDDAIGIGVDVDRPANRRRHHRVLVVVEPHQAGLRHRCRR